MNLTASGYPYLFATLLLLGGFAEVNAQTETRRPIQEWYDFFDQPLADSLLGNDFRKYYKLSTSLSGGVNLLNGQFDRITDLPRYWSTDLRFGHQTTGRKPYQQIWHYPEWGLGIYHLRFFGDTVFGDPVAAFAYVDVPVLGYEGRWNFGFHLSLGLSGGFRTFHPRLNPENIFVSSPLNVYLDAAVWISRRISPRLDLKGSGSLMHFSNGALRQPNSGLNVVGAKLQLAYHLRPRPKVFQRADLPDWRSRHGLYVYQAIGTKQLSTGGRRYLNTTTGLAYKWWSGYRNRWAVQLDYFHDRSNNSGEGTRWITPEEDRQNPANYHSVGVFIGHEAVYNRWSFVLGSGVYLWRRYPYNKLLYQRFGVRYRVWRGLEIGVGLKGRSFGANYIEWAVGYSVF